MKFTNLLIAIAIMTCSIVHASDSTQYSSEVGVQVIAQTVVAKKLVDSEARKVLNLALETGRATFGAMECDRALGTDVCSFDVFILDDETTAEAEETLYRLDVRIYQGKVSSATFTLVAG